MNTRKINLALSVGLLKSKSGNTLQSVRDLMSNFQDEVGRFTGCMELGREQLNSNHVQEQYALQYENCTLDLRLITNQATQNRQVSGFQLR